MGAVPNPTKSARDKLKTKLRKRVKQYKAKARRKSKDSDDSLDDDELDCRVNKTN